MSEGWDSSHSLAKLETVGGRDHLRIDFELLGVDVTRQTLLLRRCLFVLNAEEQRLLLLTDAEAVAELDALKTQQDPMRCDLVSD